MPALDLSLPLNAKSPAIACLLLVLATPSCGGPACGQVRCDGVCVDTSSDVANCGACGVTCSPANGIGSCARGQCVIVSCQTGFGDCDFSASNGCETDTRADPNHCGQCNHGCPVVARGTSACVAGACAVTSCMDGFGDCNKLEADGCEANLNTDLNHCGDCNFVCPASPNAVDHCRSGSCISDCKTDYAECNSKASDGCETHTSVDSRNCGQCGLVCPRPANGTAACVASFCQVGACSAGYADCNQLLADGCEVNTGTDVDNCGACGVPCRSPSKAIPACAGSVCTIGACEMAYADCNSMFFDGCEVNVQIDVKNCGKCGNACNAPANAFAGCSGAMCGIGLCNMGFADCNALVGDGCEVDAQTDVKNCGGCGKACSSNHLPNPTCANSRCGGACAMGFGDCNNNLLKDGCEANLSNDSSNCASCGRACGQGGYCLAAQCCALGFAAAVNNATGRSPASVAMGDVNGDGKADLAVANFDDSNVSVLLNHGDGTFAAAVTYGGLSSPEAIAMGDLNGDGKMDLAATNFGRANVSVFLNNGDGTFAAAVNYGTGGGPGGLAIGDVNGDGLADLVVASADATVGVLLNNGKGVFAAVVNYATASRAEAVVIGDLDGDGKPDLAVANSGTDNISVLLNVGKGAFGAATNTAAALGSVSVAIGDVDGDGDLDLAVVGSRANKVRLLTNNGKATFAGGDYASGADPSCVAIGDLDGDGFPDIAVSNWLGKNASVLRNLGVGAGFGAAMNYAAQTSPTAVAMGDLNGDGRPDLVVTNQNSNSVSILINSTKCN